MGWLLLCKGVGRVARFFLTDQNVIGEKVRITGEDAHHITRVLRLQAGDHVEVAFGSGEIGIVELTSVKSDGVEGDVVQRFRSYQEPPIRLRLYQGLAKGDKMDFVIQKAVELGVKEIVPFTSQYTVVKLEASAAEKRLRRWQRIADEAAKQCLRAELPVVRPLISFEQVLADLKEGPKDELVLLPYEHEEKQGINSVPTGEWGAVSIIIGPEGGFHPAEVEAARENGAKVVSLGPRILRTETAGLVALSLVGYRWGDLG
ncbi:MAG TPA: 16S rRNA (uracil(1498)-N(3))-methyltransferase [Firmicutes bacterium]|nr:16S rRNA (uracil(1498)-N(3))-methyltransferase [Bacillota bacterium]